eukprot:362705-Chlamydomonas_euryale.AAC.4
MHAQARALALLPADLRQVATPSKCGRMDQACAYGAVPVLMEFDADVLHVETVPLKVWMCG